ncbi:MAG: helix-turn-helix transcriptional regulator [Ktedonobacteraceae bacterium]
MSRSLSPYQKQIMSLLVSGLAVKEIAHELGRSETAIRWSVLEVRRKFKARTLAQAVSLFAEYYPAPRI